MAKIQKNACEAHTHTHTHTHTVEMLYMQQNSLVLNFIRQQIHISARGSVLLNTRCCLSPLKLRTFSETLCGPARVILYYRLLAAVARRTPAQVSYFPANRIDTGHIETMK